MTKIEPTIDGKRLHRVTQADGDLINEVQKVSMNSPDHDAPSASEKERQASGRSA